MELLKETEKMKERRTYCKFRVVIKTVREGLPDLP
jgi:hypothetical protein